MHRNQSDCNGGQPIAVPTFGLSENLQYTIRASRRSITDKMRGKSSLSENLVQGRSFLSANWCCPLLQQFPLASSLISSLVLIITSVYSPIIAIIIAFGWDTL